MFPLIAPLASAAFGSLLSRSRQSDEEKAVLRNTAEAQRIGLGAGKDMLSMGTTAYHPVVNYLSELLSGNNAALTSAAGPEIFKIGEGYRTAGRTSAALNPRGGPSAEFSAELPWAQQRDITHLLQGLRPQAAGQLGSAAGNILGNAVNSLYLSTNAGREILNSEQARRQREAANGEAIGSSIFDFLTKYGDKGGKNGLDQIMQLFSRGAGAGAPRDLPATTTGLFGNA